GGTLKPLYGPVFSATPGSFSATKQVSPRCLGSAFGSVRTSTNTSPARRPLVTHILVPLISYVSSSTFLALVLIAATSAPSSVSERETAALISPVAIRA